MSSVSPLSFESDSIEIAKAGQYKLVDIKVLPPHQFDTPANPSLTYSYIRNGRRESMLFTEFMKRVTVTNRWRVFFEKTKKAPPRWQQYGKLDLVHFELKDSNDDYLLQPVHEFPNSTIPNVHTVLNTGGLTVFRKTGNDFVVALNDKDREKLFSALRKRKTPSPSYKVGDTVTFVYNSKKYKRVLRSQGSKQGVIVNKKFVTIQQLQQITVKQ